MPEDTRLIAEPAGTDRAVDILLPAIEAVARSHGLSFRQVAAALAVLARHAGEVVDGLDRRDAAAAATRPARPH